MPSTHGLSELMHSWNHSLKSTSDQASNTLSLFWVLSYQYCLCCVRNQCLVQNHRYICSLLRVFRYYTSVFDSFWGIYNIMWCSSSNFILRHVTIHLSQCLLFKKHILSFLNCLSTLAENQLITLDSQFYFTDGQLYPHAVPRCPASCRFAVGF